MDYDKNKFLCKPTLEAEIKLVSIIINMSENTKFPLGMLS